MAVPRPVPGLLRVAILDSRQGRVDTQSGAAGQTGPGEPIQPADYLRNGTAGIANLRGIRVDQPRLVQRARDLLPKSGARPSETCDVLQLNHVHHLGDNMLLNVHAYPSH